jgi:hypothetical protein
MNKKEILFDRRVVDKNLREGIVARAEYEKFLKSLPDRDQEAQWVAIEEIAPRAYLRKALGMEKNPSDKPAEEEKPGARKKR